MINSNSDTIAAICTGMTNSGINVIRISGEKAFEIADKVFRSVSGKTVQWMKQFSVNYGYIIDSGSNATVDEVLLLKMAAPKSYTRENVIEIDCHGGIVVTRKILNLILLNDARLAEPGEFTKRAYMNGRIDLSQAEAVIDVINAKSELAAKNSVKQLKGNIREEIKELREIILSKTAYIEAALDDPEHISLEGFDEELERDISEVEKRLNKLISSADDGRLINDGINTCILGLPNAGKSSLLNSLLNENRAIVTDIAGTTRDTLRETVVFGDVTLNIIDTAGIRDTDNLIEKIGVERARSEAKNADLILYVVDLENGLTAEDKKLISELSDKKMIILYNKSDLVDKDRLPDNCASLLQPDIPDGISASVYTISTLTGQGIDELKDCIRNMFYDGSIYSEDEVIITNERHKELLINAAKSVDNVLISLRDGMTEDFLTIDLMDAYTSLGCITGDSVEDDLADKIFKEFCMGK